MARPFDPEVALQLLVNVDQARRGLNSIGDREAQAVRLPRPVIRILAEDHDADVPERRQVQRSKPVRALREDMLAALPLADEEAL